MTPPAAPTPTVNQAIALFDAGRLAEAEAACRAILAARPRETVARHVLGVACLRQGRLEDGIAALTRAAKEAPKNADLLATLGTALQAAGRGREAAQRYRAALALDPALPAVQNNLAVLLMEQGRDAEAVAALEAALRAAPDYRDALLNMGRARVAEGRLDDAVACFERILAKTPDDADSLAQLARARMRMRDYAAAAEAWRRLCTLNPGDVAARLGLARALRGAGALEDALAVTAALAAAPDAVANIHVLHADLLTALGRMDEARAHLRQATDAPRARGDAVPLARALAQAGGEGAAARLDALLAEPMSDNDRADVHLAAGRLADKQHDYERAITQFKAGNTIKARHRPFDAAEHAAGIDAAIAVFQPALFEAMAGYGDPDERPVFIVGMPRSGTTLAEQILASHSQVFGAGELEDIGTIPVEIMRRAGTEALFPDSVRALTPTIAREIAAAHLDRLQARAGGAGTLRIIDKNPYNFYMLGLIAVLFPNARVIHCRRDPLDTCLSCFFTNFEVEAPFARDLARLGAFYRDYDRLMAHWRAVLPLRIMDVVYEDTVADLDGMARRMVEFMGLGWEDACLEFWRHDRAVRTASSRQVRQPIYTSSVRRAESYRPWLGPLIDALGDLAD